MLSLLSLLIVLVAVLIKNIVNAASLNKNLCETHIIEQSTCSIGVSFIRLCNASTLNLFNTKLANSSSSVDLFWSDPMNNLTLIIETPYTQQRQTYMLFIYTVNS
jgi:hypothetical protein